MLIRIGSRGSALALWQAEHVKTRLEALGHSVDVRVITTTGDRLQTARLESVGGKGAFLKEIEDALLAGEVDLAVHSLKDVPTALPEGLFLCAVLERADPRDALVSADGRGLMAMPSGATVGTTSLRRQAQLRALRPDLVVADLRGNVDTRIRRLREGRFAAILLAMAGLSRLGRLARGDGGSRARGDAPGPRARRHRPRVPRRRYGHGPRRVASSSRAHVPGGDRRARAPRRLAGGMQRAAGRSRTARGRHCSR